MMRWVTIVFVGGTTLTLMTNEIFRADSYINGKNSLDQSSPSGNEHIVNWNNVAYVREALKYEIRIERERRGTT